MIRLIYLWWLEYKLSSYTRQAEVEAYAATQANENAKWFLLRSIELRSKIDRVRVVPLNNGGSNDEIVRSPPQD